MLSASNITMQFGAKPLFENISVKFGGGNRYGLIGANGCGKSTFMKILMGLLSPDSGEIWLEGDILKNADVNETFLLPLLVRRIQPAQQDNCFTSLVKVCAQSLRPSAIVR